MGIPSGLSAQLGFKSETVVGTAVTVDKFMALMSCSIPNNADRMPVKGIMAGRRTQHGFKKGAQKITGTVKSELNNKPMATLLTHIFGNVVTTGSGPYVHTATPGALTGKTTTMQGGFPDVTGTVNPVTWAGCKLPSGTLATSKLGMATFESKVVAMTENATGTPSLASASFLAGLIPFSFVEASIIANGASLGVVSDMSFTWDNGMATERFGVGSPTTAEPLEAGIRAYGGSVSCEFASMTAYALYLAGTEFAVVETWSNGVDILAITSNAYYTGAPMSIDGTDTLKQTLPFVCQSSTSDAGCVTAVLTSTETLAT